MTNVSCISCGNLFDTAKFNDCPHCEEKFNESLEDKELPEKLAETLYDETFEKPNERATQDFKNKLEEELK